MAGVGNVVDWLTNHGYKGKYFRFSSMNYELVEKVTKKHGASKSAANVLFATIMIWELVAAATYLSAAALCVVGNETLVQYAFFIGMGLFAGLTLGNEAFIYYDDEEEHVTMFLAQLISYIAFAVL